MANHVQLEILKRDVQLFNRLRKKNISDIIKIDDMEIDLRKEDFKTIDFSNVDLSKTNLYQADFTDVNLHEANLEEANLREAILIRANLCNANLSNAKLKNINLSGADIRGAILNGANLIGAILRGADICGASLIKAKLRGADLRGARLKYADLSGANLTETNLMRTNLIGATLNSANLSCSTLEKTKLFGAELTDCNVYGVAVWNIGIDKTTSQGDLIITKPNEPKITVDNLEVAQFIYLLLNNHKIRNIINTITSKLVLILGRFTDERKSVLDAIRETLRYYNYTPVLFDFDKPDDRNYIETVSTLAHMARFVIADFTDPKIILQEAQHIIPNVAIPFAPIYLEGSGFEPLTLYDLRKGKTYVLDTFCYRDVDHLLDNLDEIIEPAEELAGKLNQPNPIQ